ncbi:hypothetical protein GCM10023337_15750 [Paenalcaligenes hermetiae]|uniref:EAL domain-containing protein n=1 Tax=Paenalcaligenes hermetiae TaxID=1157987 RepID=A0ABP9M9X7_9BURK
MCWPARRPARSSASQVGPDFDKWVKGVLADAGLPAAYLEIELTESVAFGDPAIFPALEALRQIGVRFAADDFGTGYSCLQHLKCCPISTLKIDQSFVAGLANDHRDQTIVRTVIQLAHGLGMEVVAEGVETSASLDLLRQADCDTGQGFLFAKPMPAAAFAVFVSQWRGATMNANDPTATSCCVCCKEIPLDAAFTPEGAEYVEHFCGLECYQRFQARAKTGSETRDRSFEQQRYRASGLNLVTAAVVLWNTVYLERAAHALRGNGHAVDDALLQYLSPLGWEHINLTGDYLWRSSAKIGAGKFRPLRPLQPA